MAPRAKTQKDVLVEHAAMLEQLGAAVTALAQSQQQIVELLSKRGVTPEEQEHRREEEELAACDRVTVYHNAEEPQGFTWNAIHRYIFKPGRNDDVPVIFASMYRDWVAAKKDGEERAKRLGERKPFDQQSQLLAQTQVSMR